jgi:hypothetical protein
MEGNQHTNKDLLFIREKAFIRYKSYEHYKEKNDRHIFLLDTTSFIGALITGITIYKKPTTNKYLIYSTIGTISFLQLTSFKKQSESLSIIPSLNLWRNIHLKAIFGDNLNFESVNNMYINALQTTKEPDYQSYKKVCKKYGCQE